MFLATWMVPGRLGHVTVVFDLLSNRVDGTGLMPDKHEICDRANLENHWEDGEHALYKTFAI
jgi:hypothetical protein